jgi:hypothetical protein
VQHNPQWRDVQEVLRKPDDALAAVIVMLPAP